VGQVIRNLVGNAVKFTERGHVALEGRVDPECERIEISVEDTGIGIAPQDQEAIFQEFRQVDGSVTRKHGGTGLGLAISRRLVGLMEGEIEVRSDLGRGSVFTFWVPAYREKPVARPTQAKPESVLQMPHGWDEDGGDQAVA
jgi:signal transduction histidine kinase